VSRRPDPFEARTLATPDGAPLRSVAASGDPRLPRQTCFSVPSVELADPEET
jgi:hypothetical protein